MNGKQSDLKQGLSREVLVVLVVQEAVREEVRDWELRQRLRRAGRGSAQQGRAEGG